MQKKCKCGSVIEPPRQYTKCAPCAAEYGKKYRAKNRERINQQKKQLYQLKREIHLRKKKLWIQMN